MTNIENDAPVVPPPDFEAPPADHLAEHLTDTGNARRLVKDHGHELRYVSTWASWLTWDGRRWRRDTKGEATQRAKKVADSLWDDARKLTDTKLRQNAFRWAHNTESAGHIDAMVRMARTEPGISVDPDELDAHPWLLNVTNGTIDLRTGHLRPHDPRELLTKLAPVTHDPSARCPRWTAFLEQILPDPDVRTFVQRWAGYCLTGSVAEHKIVFAFGAGANGKSTLLNVLAHVLGDYARQAPPDLLMRRRDDPHPTGLADLQGARLVLATETAQGRNLDEALVKRLTGGDNIKARFMAKDFFEFAPTHKLVVATNHRPGIAGTDHGIWRRIRLVPFDIVIADEHQDRQLEHKLTLEADGILRWALDGCLDWQRDGLTEPNAVVAATADYRAEMDVLGDWISDCCVLVAGVNARAAQLFESYTRWCEAMGEHAMSQRKLGGALRERGLHSRTSNGVIWDGIGLKATTEPGASRTESAHQQRLDGTNGDQR